MPKFHRQSHHSVNIIKQTAPANLQAYLVIKSNNKREKFELIFESNFPLVLAGKRKFPCLWFEFKIDGDN